MPKLYITDFQPNKIIHKWEKLDPYYVKKNTKDTIYSNEGIFSIRGSRLFRLNPVDVPVVILDEGFTVDNSYFIEKEVDSQIPYEHVRDRKEQLYFCVGKRSGIQLIVEGTYRRSAPVAKSILTSQVEDKYYNFIPSDIYFYTQDNTINNKLFIEEVNVLLSIVR
jgi:hypothetical protein